MMFCLYRTTVTKPVFSKTGKLAPCSLLIAVEQNFKSQKFILMIFTYWLEWWCTCQHLWARGKAKLSVCDADWQIHKTVKLSYIWHDRDHKSDNCRTSGKAGVKNTRLNSTTFSDGWWGLEGGTVRIGLTTQVICKSDQREQLSSSARVSVLSVAAKKKQQKEKKLWNHLVKAWSKVNIRTDRPHLDVQWLTSFAQRLC